VPIVLASPCALRRRTVDVVPIPTQHSTARGIAPPVLSRQGGCPPGPRSPLRTHHTGCAACSVLHAGVRWEERLREDQPLLQVVHDRVQKRRLPCGAQINQRRTHRPYYRNAVGLSVPQRNKRPHPHAPARHCALVVAGRSRTAYGARSDAARYKLELRLAASVATAPRLRAQGGQEARPGHRPSR
jgi:hypothetical protein